MRRLSLPVAMLLLFAISLCSAGGCSRDPAPAMSVEQIDRVKLNLGALRPGMSRNAMWETLNPMLDGIRLQTIDDASSPSHVTQSYDMGHGYVLRLFFDPKNPDIFRRAEVVHRP